MKIVPLIKIFFEALNSREINYCHWKSNHSINSFLEGEGDLDILVSQESQKGFKEALEEFKFKEITSPKWEQTPYVYHYYGLDEETGRIVHIHAYFKLLTGGNLIKNYHLPLTETLLKNSSEYNGIRIPDPSTEFLVFVIRKILEGGTLPDFLFVLREASNIEKEFKWLNNLDTSNKAKAHLPNVLPELDLCFFDECTQALNSRPRFFRSTALSRKLQRKFSSYAINSPLKNKLLIWKKFFHVLYQKFIVRKPAFNFKNGGAFIAFTGVDGSGKSTHISKTKEWLHKFVSVKKVHSGKPPATFFTFLPRIFLPLFRKLLPNQRTNFIEFKSHASSLAEKQKAHYSYFYLIRSIMIAFDQRSLINKVRHQADRGEIIISDRFPSTVTGGMDGPRVDPSFFSGHSPIKRFLAIIEQNIYHNISKPDLVFKISVPLETNIERLLSREEEIGDDIQKQVQSRKAVMDKWELPGVPVQEIDNTAPIEEVQSRIKRTIWDLI